MRFGMGMGMRPRGGWVALSGAALDLDFARNHASGGTFAGLTVVRATPPTSFAETTAGTLTSFANMTLRMTDKGLLMEESRVNSCLRSQEWEHATWTYTSARITPTANQTTAPDGTLTADLVTEDLASGQHSITQSISWTTATTYTLSFYAKAGTGSILQLTVGSAAFSGLGYVNYNVSTGVISQTGGTMVGSTITALANGWYRCTLTMLATATASANFQLSIMATGTDTRGQVTQGAGRTFYLWGAQVEVGPFATSYIATTTAPVTRATDVVTLTSIPFYNATAGTLYAEYNRISNSASGRAWLFNDNTTNEQIRLVPAVSTAIRPDFQVVDGGATQANITGPVEVAVGGLIKQAAAYAANDFQQAVNGTLGTADVAGTLPTVTRAEFGQAGAGGTSLNGYLKRVAYWNTRLANATLQSLTV